MSHLAKTQLIYHTDIKNWQIRKTMSHLIPVDGGLGVQIPPHIISAGHLENADLLFEVTAKGVLIRPETQKSEESVSLADLIDSSPFKRDCF